MNQEQEKVFQKFVRENECTFKLEGGWGDFKGLHTFQVKELLKTLLKLS